jgi:hypothetical protein
VVSAFKVTVAVRYIIGRRIPKGVVMKNLFGGLEKTMKEGQDRWKRIEALTEELKTNPEASKLAETLILLVEHFRPLYSYDLKAEDLNLDKILKNLKKR